MVTPYAYDHQYSPWLCSGHKQVVLYAPHRAKEAASSPLSFSGMDVRCDVRNIRNPIAPIMHRTGRRKSGKSCHVLGERSIHRISAEVRLGANREGRSSFCSKPFDTTVVRLGARTVDTSYARFDAHSIPDLNVRSTISPTPS